MIDLIFEHIYESTQVVDFYMGNLEQIHKEVIICESPKIMCLAFPEDEFSKSFLSICSYIQNWRITIWCHWREGTVVRNGIQSTFSAFLSSFSLWRPKPPRSASPLENYAFLFLQVLIFNAWGYSASSPLIRAVDSEVWMTKRPALPSRCWHSWNVYRTKSNSLLQNSLLAEIYFYSGVLSPPTLVSQMAKTTPQHTWKHQWTKFMGSILYYSFLALHDLIFFTSVPSPSRWLLIP